MTDHTVIVKERWTRDGRGERKIGDGPWEPIDNLTGRDAPPFVQYTHVPILGREFSDLGGPSIEQLSRNIYELGHADNTIEVYEYLGYLAILCGHCHQITHPKINSGWFCCRWAGGMYTRYFEHQLAGITVGNQ